MFAVMGAAPLLVNENTSPKPIRSANNETRPGRELRCLLRFCSDLVNVVLVATIPPLIAAIRDNPVEPLPQVELG